MNTRKRILHIALLMVPMLCMGIRVQANDVIQRHWPLQFIQPIHVESPLYYWADYDFHDEDVELNEPVSIDSFDPITKTCQRTATYTYDGKNYEDVIDFHLVEETTNQTYTISIHNLHEGKYRLWIDYYDTTIDDGDFYDTGIEFEPTWATTDDVHYVGTFQDGTTEKQLKTVYIDHGGNHYGVNVTIYVKPYEIRDRRTDTIFFNSHDIQKEGGVSSFCYKPYNSRPEVVAETRPFLNVSSCIVINLADWVFSDQYAYGLFDYPTPIYHLWCTGSSESTLPDCDKDVKDNINLIYCPTVEHGDTIICIEGTSINFHGRILELGTHHDVEYYHIDQDFNAKSKHHFYNSIKVTHPMDANGIYAQPAEGGSVAIQGHTPGQKYCYGETIKFVVTPDECYEMVGWEDGYDTQSTTREVTLAEGMLGAYRPVLSRSQITINGNLNMNGGCIEAWTIENPNQIGEAICKGSTMTMDCGRELNYKAVATEGVTRFVRWMDDPNGTLGAERVMTLTENTTLGAIFEVIKDTFYFHIGDKTDTVVVRRDEELNAPNPAREDDICNKNYVFTDWSSPVTKDTKEYTANYTSTEVKYTVVFKNEDGTTFKAVENLSCHAQNFVPNEVPTKDPTPQNTYTFSDWGEIKEPWEKSEYTPSFTPSPRQYDITFKNFNGEVLQTVQVNYGETPQYTGSTPIREGNVYENYTWNGWTPAIVAASSNATYTATFTSVPIEYNINLAVKDNVGGSITVNNNGPYHYGDNVQINAVPNIGYTFVKWTETQSTDPHINLNVGGNVTYTAEFAKVHTVTIYVNGQAYGHVNVSGSTLSHEGNTYTFIDNADITITAVPEDDGCSDFIRWTDLGTNTPVSRMIKVTEDMNFIAVFAKKQYHITCNPSNGSVTIYDKDGNVISDNDANCGEKVTLVAQPAQGYHFVEWSDGVTTASRDINPISEDIILNVTFEQNVVDVDIKTDDEEGEVTIDLTEDNDGDGQIGIGDKITITAPTKDCKEFEKWSDENEDNPRVIEVIGDINLTAQYKTVKYTITTQVKPDGENVHGTTSAEIVNE